MQVYTTTFTVIIIIIIIIIIILLPPPICFQFHNVFSVTVQIESKINETEKYRTEPRALPQHCHLLSPWETKQGSRWILPYVDSQRNICTSWITPLDSYF